VKETLCGIIGSPNSGKSTIFNNLTLGNQKIGNWPGVTVEKKVGRFAHRDILVNVVDLPGTYSLTPYSLDEKISRDFILNGNPDTVVVVVNAGTLAQSLYLAIELLELGINIVIDLNMMDIAEKLGLEINYNVLSRILGARVVPTIADRNIGTENLKDAIVESALKKDSKVLSINYGAEIESALEKLVALLNERKPSLKYPARYVALKLLESCGEVEQEVLQDESIKAFAKEGCAKLSKALGGNPESIFFEKRHGFICGLIHECVRRKLGIKERIELTDRIDKVVLNKFVGIPLMLLAMFLAFQFVFTFGKPFTSIFESFFDFLGNLVGSITTHLGAPDLFSSFLKDALIGGVGTVVMFLPNMFFLFFLIAILEDSGYMARAAFVVDTFMHKLGLHSKSFIPMIMGFGCNVPAIMACRTLRSEKDRILTILIIPLMSCSARLPIYILFTSVFFQRYQGLVVFSLYILGILYAVLVARIFRGLFFKGETDPLIIEFPTYRVPRLKYILLSAWQSCLVFLKRAGTFIFFGVVILWILGNLPPGVEYASKESIVGRLGSIFAPLFSPAGFGFWQAAVALIFGFYAKELVVGALGTMLASENLPLEIAIKSYFTPVSAYGFMIMSLLYMPCFAAISTIKSETNWRWALLAISYTLVLGWISATAFYTLASLFHIT